MATLGAVCVTEKPQCQPRVSKMNVTADKMTIAGIKSSKVRQAKVAMPSSVTTEDVAHIPAAEAIATI